MTKLSDENRFHSISRRTLLGVTAAGAVGTVFPRCEARSDEEEGEINLLVRGDDLGAARSFNSASIECYESGIARSVEVLVPGPWFLDAAQRLKKHPDLDVGVHLCLTSEWDAIKWRPLTSAPSLVDADGYFHPRTSLGGKKPLAGSSGFLESQPKLEEVECELQAQIELLLKHLPRATHLSAHMGAALATPPIKAITLALAKKFSLRLEGEGTKTPLKHLGGVGSSQQSSEEKEQSLLDALARLEPGNWLLVTHPAHDDAETRGISHPGYENVAADRDGITKMLTSQRVKKAVAERKIRLISYADLQ